jgi:hypothetical protein
MRYCSRVTMVRLLYARWVQCTMPAVWRVPGAAAYPGESVVSNVADAVQVWQRHTAQEGAADCSSAPPALAMLCRQHPGHHGLASLR